MGQACEDYGTRVQKSVFECQVGQKEWARLRDRLLREIKVDEDSLRFYFLDEKAVTRTEHHGDGRDRRESPRVRRIWRGAFNSL